MGMCTAGLLLGDITKQPWGPGVTFAAGRATSFMALPSSSASQTGAGRIRSSANKSDVLPSPCQQMEGLSVSMAPTLTLGVSTIAHQDIH